MAATGGIGGGGNDATVGGGEDSDDDSFWDLTLDQAQKKILSVENEQQESNASGTIVLLLTLAVTRAFGAQVFCES